MSESVLNGMRGRINIPACRSCNWLQYITEDTTPLFTCPVDRLSFSYRAWLWASTSTSFQLANRLSLNTTSVLNCEVLFRHSRHFTNSHFCSNMLAHHVTVPVLENLQKIDLDQTVGIHEKSTDLEGLILSTLRETNKS